MFNPSLESYSFFEAKYPIYGFESLVSLEVLDSYNTLLKLLQYLVESQKIAVYSGEFQGDKRGLFLKVDDENFSFLYTFPINKETNERDSFETSIRYIISQLVLYVSFILQVNSYVVDELFDINSLDIIAMHRLLDRIDAVMKGDLTFDNNIPAEFLDELYHVNDMNVIIFWSVCIALKENSIPELRKKIEWFSRVWMKPSDES